MNPPDQTRHIVFLVPHHSTLLDVCGPMDVFQKAIERMEETDGQPEFTYRTHVVSTRRGKRIDLVGNLTILGEGSYAEIDYPIDTLVIGGRSKNEEYRLGPEVLRRIAGQSAKVRRMCSVCGGAFILAEAGVLKNRKAATHWMLCDKLAAEYPDTEVDHESIFVRDGNIYTSAGITSGMDLALALIEEDLGRAFALRVARVMVLFLKRPGYQTQFSTLLEYQSTDYEPVARALDWIVNHLDEEISVEKLAEYTRMSPRNFARVFVRETNVTPMKYVEKLRLESACRLLTETSLTVDEIAGRCGFKSSVNIDRLFVKSLGTTPSRYRERFTSTFG